MFVYKCCLFNLKVIVIYVSCQSNTREGVFLLSTFIMSSWVWDVGMQQRFCWNTLTSLYMSRNFTFCSHLEYWCGFRSAECVCFSSCCLFWNVKLFGRKRHTETHSSSCIRDFLSHTIPLNWPWDYCESVKMRMTSSNRGQIFSPTNSAEAESVACWCNTYY